MYHPLGFTVTCYNIPYYLLKTYTFVYFFIYKPCYYLNMRVTLLLHCVVRGVPWLSIISNTIVVLPLLYLSCYILIFLKYKPFQCMHCKTIVNGKYWRKYTFNFYVLTFFHFGPYIFILPLLIPKPINAWHLSPYRHPINRKSWRGWRHIKIIIKKNLFWH